MVKRRVIPVREQLQRTAELDVLRLQRPLTPAEEAEADNLSLRAYHRAWRAAEAQREAKLRGTGR